MNCFARLVCVTLFVLAAGPFALADEPQSGIEVTGIGEARARPNRIEIDVRAGGLAELSGDAVVKYRDSLRRMTEAFEKLKLDGLEVQPQQVAIGTSGGAAAGNMVVAMQGRAAGASKTQIEIGRGLKLVLRYPAELAESDVLDRVTRLLDTAKDAGASVGKGEESALLLRMMGQTGGTSPAVTFVCEDAEKFRTQAYERAFTQAEKQAQRLAQLAHVRLGRVLAVREVAVEKSATSSQQQMIMALYGIGKTDEQGDARIISHELGEIPLRVMLFVRFAVEPLESAR